MAEPVNRQSVQVADWPGLFTNAGPVAGPAGSADEQVNLACNVPGLLAARPGYTKVRFDEED